MSELLLNKQNMASDVAVTNMWKLTNDRLLKIVWAEKNNLVQISVVCYKLYLAKHMVILVD